MACLSVLPAVVHLFMLDMIQHACDGNKAVYVRVRYLYIVLVCMAHQ